MDALAMLLHNQKALPSAIQTIRKYVDLHGGNMPTLPCVALYLNLITVTPDMTIVVITLLIFGS